MMCNGTLAHGIQGRDTVHLMQKKGLLASDKCTEVPVSGILDFNRDSFGRKNALKLGKEIEKRQHRAAM